MVGFYARMVLIGGLAVVGFIISLLFSSHFGFCVPIGGACG